MTEEVFSYFATHFLSDREGTQRRVTEDDVVLSRRFFRYVDSKPYKSLRVNTTPCIELKSWSGCCVGRLEGYDPIWYPISKTVAMKHFLWCHVFSLGKRAIIDNLSMFQLEINLLRCIKCGNKWREATYEVDVLGVKTDGEAKFSTLWEVDLSPYSLS